MSDPSHPPLPLNKSPSALARVLHKMSSKRGSVLVSRLQAAVYRATGGRLMKRFTGKRVVVLETVGRKSGRVRHTPVIPYRFEDKMVVIPSNGGADPTPAWWLNLRHAGRGWVIDGQRRIEVSAREAVGSERQELWRRFVEFNRLAEQYQALSSRQAPIVVLEPIPRSGSPV